MALDAIITDPSQDLAFDPINRFPSQRDLARVCGALVTIDWLRPEKPSGVLRIAHFSVREYLTSNKIPPDFQNALKQPEAAISFTKISLGYLRHIPKFPCSVVERITYPLTGFAMQLPYFAYGLHEEESVVKEIAHFFTSDAYHSFVRLYNRWDSIKTDYYAEFPDVSDHLWILSSLELDDYLLPTMTGDDSSYLLNQHVEAPSMEPRHSENTTIPLSSTAPRLNLGRLRPSFSEFDPLIRICGGSCKPRVREETALYLAARKGWSSIVEALLLHDFKSHIQGGEHGTALNAAMYFDKPDVVDILQKHYENTLDPQHFTSAVLNTMKCEIGLWKSEKFHDWLEKPFWLQKALNRLAFGHSGFGEVLRTALLYGDQDLVDWTLENSPSLVSQGVIESTIVDTLRFCEVHHVETILRMVNDSSHENLATRSLIGTHDGKYRRSDLHWAASKGYVGVTLSLIKLRGADIHLKDRFGETPLHCAAREGQTEVARILISHGADTEAVDDSFRTPLLSAFLQGHHHTCQIFSPTELGLPLDEFRELDTEVGSIPYDKDSSFTVGETTHVWFLDPQKFMY